MVSPLKLGALIQTCDLLGHSLGLLVFLPVQLFLFGEKCRPLLRHTLALLVELGDVLFSGLYCFA